MEKEKERIERELKIVRFPGLGWLETVLQYRSLDVEFGHKR